MGFGQKRSTAQWDAIFRGRGRFQHQSVPSAARGAELSAQCPTGPRVQLVVTSCNFRIPRVQESTSTSNPAPCQTLFTWGIWESEALGEPSGGAVSETLLSDTRHNRRSVVTSLTPHKIPWEHLRCCFNVRHGDMLWHAVICCLCCLLLCCVYATSNASCSWLSVEVLQDFRCSFNRRLPDKTADVMRQIERGHV